MQEKLDEAGYREGRDAFAAGASIRSIVERCEASDTPLDDLKSLSAAIGFADALLDRLRRPAVILNPSNERPIHE